MKLRGWASRVALLLLMLGQLSAWAVDETSSGDKLRILYSNRLTFTENGTPLITVEIMGGQSIAHLSADAGLVVMPDGEGGSEIGGKPGWSVRVENARAGVVREWIVVARLRPDAERDADKAMATWSGRGFAPKTFEVGTVFGTGGGVIDTREILVALDPKPHGKGQERADALSRRFRTPTWVHEELIRRPEGTVVAESDGVVVKNPAVIWFAPKNRVETVEVLDVEIGGGGSQLQTTRETRRYFGAVYATVGIDGKLSLVNAVPETQLLAGLVPSEMFANAPDEALAAQAVAARTELLQKVGQRHLGDPFLLCSTQHCQVYSGAGKEHPRTTRAVERTRGMVLSRKDGTLVDARYSAACGGHGEHNEAIWGGAPDPELRGHVDAPAGSALAKQFSSGGITEDNLEGFLADKSSGFCAKTTFSPGRYRWEKEIPVAEISALVAEKYPEVGSVLALRALTRGISGRVVRMEIRGARRTVEVAGDLAIRRLLGGLKSSLFVVNPVGNPEHPTGFRIRGAGFGHGVGLCQLGAMGMAEAGKTFQDILRHYYPDVQLQRLY